MFRNVLHGWNLAKIKSLNIIKARGPEAPKALAEYAPVMASRGCPSKNKFGILNMIFWPLLGCKDKKSGTFLPVKYPKKLITLQKSHFHLFSRSAPINSVDAFKLKTDSGVLNAVTILSLLFVKTWKKWLSIAIEPVIHCWKIKWNKTSDSYRVYNHNTRTVFVH